eukprot:scaffold75485_cov79-Cyclotella_meneghiniana.AAC.2
MEGQRRQQQPQHRPPNNESNEHPPPNVIELWNEICDDFPSLCKPFHQSFMEHYSDKMIHSLSSSSTFACLFITVVWGKAVDSLEAAYRHLHPSRASPEARTFLDTRMATIISILLEQQVGKIGRRERECVEKSVRVALTIARDDLETLVQRDGSNNGSQKSMVGRGHETARG